jgi:DeoR/GlpR family transcriptional regulator of sugar metabolism
MLSDERRQQIIDLLKEKKFVGVPELASTFYTSEATIRRDLDKLKKSGVLKRTYGGAVLIEGLDSDIPLILREDERTEEKIKIASLASKLINADDVIIIDSSSTCAKMVTFLNLNKPKTIITNSPKTALSLAKSYNDINIYSTGGFLRSSSVSYVGESARNMVSGLYVDTLFFSCVGASILIGLTDSSEEEAELKRTMLKHSKKKAVLLDSKKFEQNAFAKICDYSEIDYLICEKELDQEWIDHLVKSNVTIIYP